jgi:uncharacterized protein YgbK (DUF1537 family)
MEQRTDYEKILEWSKINNIGIEFVSKKIAETIGVIVNLLMYRHKLSGLFVTGGDIAISIITSLKADGSVIIDEMETGIPVLKIWGGPHDGVNLITKAGGFGRKDSISHAIKYLKNLRI